MPLKFFETDVDEDLGFHLPYLKDVTYKESHTNFSSGFKIVETADILSIIKPKYEILCYLSDSLMKADI